MYGLTFTILNKNVSPSPILSYRSVRYGRHSHWNVYATPAVKLEVWFLSSIFFMFLNIKRMSKTNDNDDNNVPLTLLSRNKFYPTRNTNPATQLNPMPTQQKHPTQNNRLVAQGSANNAWGPAQSQQPPRTVAQYPIYNSWEQHSQQTQQTPQQEQAQARVLARAQEAQEAQARAQEAQAPARARAQEARARAQEARAQIQGQGQNVQTNAQEQWLHEDYEFKQNTVTEVQWSHWLNYRKNQLENVKLELYVIGSYVPISYLQISTFVAENEAYNKLTIQNISIDSAKSKLSRDIPRYIVNIEPFMSDDLYSDILDYICRYNELSAKKKQIEHAIKLK